MKMNRLILLAVLPWFLASCGEMLATEIAGISETTEAVASANNLAVVPIPLPEFIPDYITIQGVPFSTELTELDLTRWMLEEYGITALRYMVNLTHLNLNHNNGLSDLSPLAGLTNLTELRLLDNAATDFSPLAGLTNLTKLELTVRNFDDADLTPLMNLTNLTNFRLTLGGVSYPTEDISRLADLPTLTRLDMWHNQISDLSPLAGLANLRSLDLSFNPISDLSPLASVTNLRSLSVNSDMITDISPLANLPNLRSVHLRYNTGMDLSPLQNTPPQVPSPSATMADNPHPFAVALSEFFVNLTTPGYDSWDMPHSYHAVLVDIDGNGTLGVVASRWFFDGARPPCPSSWGSVSIQPRFEQKLFFIHDNQLHEVDWQSWSVTPSGRLVKVDAIGASDILFTMRTLLTVADGRLIAEKTLGISEYTMAESTYSVNYHNNANLIWSAYDEPHFWLDFEEHTALTHEEFHEIMERHGLHGAGVAWRLPNVAYEILGLSAG
ncbi:MAG: leucine-rich repeat domain-containing protein [Defluviitaleaceae bacterium]|nr:leucine-rich repeat domain-containing protein [Defluviitaleaceae bacterium]